MSATAYYNDISDNSVKWLHYLRYNHLIDSQATISQDDIREIRKISGDSAHFFAGIAGWSRALQLVGWNDEIPLWTGSCPCQPFSNAGKRASFNDHRHLWPEWFRLIKKYHPHIIFGEQVVSPEGRKWYKCVKEDLSSKGYEVAAADLPAASVGAPHGRSRLWFVATTELGRELLSDAVKNRPSSNWRNFDLIGLSDNSLRPVEPSKSPLAGKAKKRVGLISGYGNAIVPQVAAAFIYLAAISSQKEGSLENNLEKSVEKFNEYFDFYTFPFYRFKYKVWQESNFRIPALRATHRPILLNNLLIKGWGTPTARDWKDGATARNVDKGILSQQVLLAGWSTPLQKDSTGSQYCYGKDRKKILKLPGQAIYLLKNPIRIDGKLRISLGKEAGITGDRLNPEHCRWLMGYPDGWSY